jgi:glycine dehydrogenase
MTESGSTSYQARHIGPGPAETASMLKAIGLPSLDALVERTLPDSIRSSGPMGTGSAMGEQEMLDHLRSLGERNLLYRSYIGLGYSGTITPSPIRRNIFENPGWYTQYTPYQAEIAQGRLEALLNFQTMITDLTGMEIANASLLDEGTAAAEAMTLCLRQRSRKSSIATSFFVSELCHPQTIGVVQTRAEPLGIEVVVGDAMRRMTLANPRLACWCNTRPPTATSSITKPSSNAPTPPTLWRW